MHWQRSTPFPMYHGAEFQAQRYRRHWSGGPANMPLPAYLRPGFHYFADMRPPNSVYAQRPRQSRAKSTARQRADERMYTQLMNHANVAQRSEYREPVDSRAIPSFQPPQAHQPVITQTETSPGHPLPNREPPIAHQASTVQKKTFQQLQETSHMHTAQPLCTNHAATSLTEACHQLMNKDHMQIPQASSVARLTEVQHIQNTRATAAGRPKQRRQPNKPAKPGAEHHVDQTSIQLAIQANSEMSIAAQTSCQSYADHLARAKASYMERAAEENIKNRHTITPWPVATEKDVPPRENVLGAPNIVYQPETQTLETAQIVYQPLTDTFATAQVVYQPKTDMYTRAQIVYQPRTNTLAASHLVYQPRTDMIATAETFYQPAANMMATRQTMFQPQEDLIRTTEAVYQSQADILATRQMNYHPRENLLNTTEAIYQPMADSKSTGQNSSQAQDEVPTKKRKTRSKNTDSMYQPQSNSRTTRKSSSRSQSNKQKNKQPQIDVLATNQPDYKSQTNFSYTTCQQEQQMANSKATLYESQKAPILRQMLCLEQKQDGQHTSSYYPEGNTDATEQIQWRNPNEALNKTTSTSKKNPLTPKETLRQTRKRKLSSDCTPRSLLVTHPPTTTKYTPLSENNLNTLTESEWLTRLESLALSRTAKLPRPESKASTSSSVTQEESPASMESAWITKQDSVAITKLACLPLPELPHTMQSSNELRAMETVSHPRAELNIDMTARRPGRSLHKNATNQHVQAATPFYQVISH